MDTERKNKIIGAAAMAALVVLVVGLYAANRAAERSDRERFCKTEGTAQYRGNVDNERALRYIHLCK